MRHHNASATPATSGGPTALSVSPTATPVGPTASLVVATAMSERPNTTSFGPTAISVDATATSVGASATTVGRWSRSEDKERASFVSRCPLCPERDTVHFSRVRVSQTEKKSTSEARKHLEKECTRVQKNAPPSIKMVTAWHFRAHKCTPMYI
jgi:hypothetical protein